MPKLNNVLRREWLVLLLILAVAIIAAVQVFRVSERMSAIRSAPQDNVQWTLAQLDVEAFALNLAVEKATREPAVFTPEVQTKLEILIGRVEILAATRLFQDSSPSAKAQLMSLQNELAKLEAVLKSELSSGKVDFIDLGQKVSEIRKMCRVITLTSVKTFSLKSDATRNEFANLLGSAALFNAFLIFGLGAALVFLMRQMVLSRRNAKELRLSSDRQVNTVNVSLDAIVVADLEGKVVDFNPAACSIFGYSRASAIGRGMDELIIPHRLREAHRKGMERFRNTRARVVIGAGRIEMPALHANGNEFPVEMALGTIPGPDGPQIIAFMRDISDRKKAEADLRKARDEAVLATQVKSQFLAVMSHEMRTPLNGVMAVLDLLDETKITPKQSNYVRTALTSAEILKQHLDDVLDVTRIQAGKMEFHLQNFDLLELLEEVKNLNTAATLARGNRIILDAKIPNPHFISDRKRIHQVLTNLISNAGKFTQNGVISVHVKWRGVKEDVVDVEFAVVDTGIGISADQHERIFEDFVTLDPSYQRNAAGTGLGLPICRSIVEGLGGKIGVESAPGQGSKFWFVLPLMASTSDPSLMKVVKKAPLKPKNKSNNLKVLLVEDNEINRFVAAEMLQQSGSTVVFAQDGFQAIEKTKQQLFDLILMDISMPRMDGWQAASLISSDQSNLNMNTPIIALTAHALPEEQAKFAASGMKGALTKPMRSKDLQNLLQKYHSNPPSKRSLTPMAAAQNSHDLDKSVTDELRDVLGEAQFDSRYKKFVEEVASVPQELEMHLHEGDKVKASQIAHRAAGSAAIFGATNLHQALLRFESACTDPAAGDLSVALKGILNAVKKLL